MKLPKYLITVTPLSKTLALVLFVIFPFIGFFLGMKYQQLIEKINQPLENVTIPSSIKTINLKTFTNTTYHYSFQYPTLFAPGDVVGNTLNINTKNSVLLYPSSDLYAAGYPAWYVDVIPSSKSSTLEYNNDGFMQNLRAYLSTNIGETVNPPNEPFHYQFVRHANRTVDGNIAEVFENPTRQEKRIVIQKNNLLYIIGGYSTSAQESPFSTILPTFHFTNH